MSMVHIIGAGLAGLSAAVHLAKSNHRVCLYEATSQAGGRCRSYHDPILDCEIDNGNHLLLKANTHSFEFLALTCAEQFWQPTGNAYHFTDIAFDTSWQLKPPYWLPKLPLISYVALLRLLIAGKNATVSQCISGKSNLYKHFVEPICISALNTHPDDASASAFRSVLMRIHRAGKDGAIPYLATQPFQQSLVGPAIEYLKAHQLEIYYRKRLTGMESEQNQLTMLRFTDQTVAIGPDDHVILALPAQAIESLLPDITTPNQFESIINGHFAYDAPDKHRIIGLSGGLTEWIIIKDNVVSTTTSAANRYGDMDQDDIAKRLWRDIQAALSIHDDMPAYRIVTEKRATFKASPEQFSRRPDMQTTYSNLLLAGDYTDTSLPATIEGSILSGKRAASAIPLAS